MSFLALGARLKALREKSGWSVEELAEKLQIPAHEWRSYEAESDFPRIALLIRFSKLSGVNVADIFRERPSSSDFELIRKKDRPKKSPLIDPGPEAIKEYQYEPLTVSDGSKHMDAYIIELPPFQAERPHPDQMHPGEEFVYVLSGRIRGKVHDKEFELEEGDAVYLRSRSPHSFYNPGSKAALALTVIYPY